MSSPAGISSIAETENRPDFDTPKEYRLINRETKTEYPHRVRSAPQAPTAQTVENNHPDRQVSLAEYQASEVLTNEARPQTNDNSPHPLIDTEMVRVLDLETASQNEVDRITAFANDVAAATINVLEMHNKNHPTDKRESFRYEIPPRSGKWKEIKIARIKPKKEDPAKKVYTLTISEVDVNERNLNPRDAKVKKDGVLVLRVEDAVDSISQPIGRASVNVTGCGVIEKGGKERRVYQAQEVERLLLEKAPIPVRPNRQTQGNAERASTNRASTTETQRTNPTSGNEINTNLTAQELNAILFKDPSKLSLQEMYILNAKAMEESARLYALQESYTDSRTTSTPELMQLSQQIYETRNRILAYDTKRRLALDSMMGRRQVTPSNPTDRQQQSVNNPQGPEVAQQPQSIKEKIKEAEDMLDVETLRLESLRNKLSQGDVSRIQVYLEETEPSEENARLSFLRRKGTVIGYIADRLTNETEYIREIDGLVSRALASNPDITPEERHQLHNLQAKVEYSPIDPEQLEAFIKEVNKHIKKTNAKTTQPQDNSANKLINKRKANAGVNPRPRKQGHDEQKPKNIVGLSKRPRS